MIRKYGWIIVIAVLAAIAPFSSESPDAMQRVLGLPGGGKSIFEVVSGIVVVALVMMGIAFILERAGKGSRK
jgi:hypothetical protein